MAGAQLRPVAHQEHEISFGEYLTTGHFWEASTENWESEFLQMGAFVLLTIFLIQKGSPESKQPGGDDVDEDPRKHAGRSRRTRPGAARWASGSSLYENSLLIAFFALFFASIVLHAISGVAEYNAEGTVAWRPADQHRCSS